MVLGADAQGEPSDTRCLLDPATGHRQIHKLTLLSLPLGPHWTRPPSPSPGRPTDFPLSILPEGAIQRVKLKFQPLEDRGQLWIGYWDRAPPTPLKRFTELLTGRRLRSLLKLGSMAIAASGEPWRHCMHPLPHQSTRPSLRAGNSIPPRRQQALQHRRATCHLSETTTTSPLSPPCRRSPSGPLIP